ncbi:hypothetical protein Tsubulata_041660 [Turnera subulata]|uniref:Uncharacterized protein n=1 Tax=Turnera subulata TaxID=218843 RepID=A0A9Q0JLF5_9ROSI|nr:hypothetical protein Tsubulata_041660 [Turnera subulata]
MGFNYCSANLLCPVLNFFESQARVMDRELSPSFTIPPGSIHSWFSTLSWGWFWSPSTAHSLSLCSRNILIFPEAIHHCNACARLFISIFAMTIASLVEKKRRDSSPLQLSVFWLFPQCFLVGTAKAHLRGAVVKLVEAATGATRERMALRLQL